MKRGIHHLTESMKVVSSYMLFTNTIDPEVHKYLYSWLKINMTSLSFYISIDYRLIVEYDSFVQTKFKVETATFETLVSIEEAVGRFKKNGDINAERLTALCSTLLSTIIRTYNDLGHLGRLLHILIEEVSKNETMLADAFLASYFDDKKVFRVSSYHFDLAHWLLNLCFFRSLHVL